MNKGDHLKNLPLFVISFQKALGVDMHKFTSQSLPAMPQKTILCFTIDILNLQQATLYFKVLCAIYRHFSEILILAFRKLD